MAVPAHDQRDFEFATKVGLPIVRVVAQPGGRADEPLDAAYVDNDAGVLVNSGKFDGHTVPDGKREITQWLAATYAGKGVINYRLHDWCISRQRYWARRSPSSTATSTARRRWSSTIRR